MSTRSCVHFCYDKDKTAAIVYRHYDGDVLGKDLKEFLTEVQKNVEDNRFTDPSYLAAKFVVWQAKKYANENHYLNFLGVGIMLQDAGDIEYRYKVICNNLKGRALPKIICQHVSRIYK
jgi:hypothetical protein